LRFLSAASYGAVTQSAGVVRLRDETTASLAGQHVLVLDTILDSGLTLRTIDTHVRAQSPASLRHCVLLQKQRGAPAAIAADYVGFTIADRFVVGYGLDFAERYRNLPYLAVLQSPAH
jgi:hypoxanthine phosphoribosyltransferase